MPHSLRAGLARYFRPEQLDALAAAHVALAGCGGLGSNVALMLARCGVEHFLLIDHDVVDCSNLNRQQFWPADVGKPKVEALAGRLRELNPHVQLDVRQMKLDATNLSDLLTAGSPQSPMRPSICPSIWPTIWPSIWVEALDDATTKALLVEKALASGCRIVAASGIAGYGGAPMQLRRMGKLALVGDFVSDVADAPPLAPHVTQAAAMMADVVLGWILDGTQGQ